MAPRRVALAAAVVVLCLLEYGSAADVLQALSTVQVAVPSTTTASLLAISSGGSGGQGKRQAPGPVIGETTVGFTVKSISAGPIGSTKLRKRQASGQEALSTVQVAVPTTTTTTASLLVSSSGRSGGGGPGKRQASPLPGPVIGETTVGSTVKSISAVPLGSTKLRKRQSSGQEALSTVQVAVPITTTTTSGRSGGLGKRQASLQPVPVTGETTVGSTVKSISAVPIGSMTTPMRKRQASGQKALSTVQVSVPTTTTTTASLFVSPSGGKKRQLEKRQIIDFTTSSSDSHDHDDHRHDHV